VGELAVSLKEVSKRYGEFVAVDKVSFEVETGVIYGILGPNGAGKTTTLRMMNNILMPDEGSIELFGSLPPGRRAAVRIGYLPEERGLYPKMRVAETLQFFGELRGLSARDAKKRAAEWLERLQIARWGKSRVQELSKGMQQKVQFASALLHDPDLLILDEPWSGLDPINARVLRDIVLSRREAGATVLFSTHLMDHAEQLCDKVCIIARGKKVLEGELAAIRRSAAADRIVALDFEVEFEANEAARGIVDDPANVRRVVQRKGHVEVELADGTSSSSLLGCFLKAGVELRRFEVVTPTLQQIFIDRVGVEGARTDRDAS